MGRVASSVDNTMMESFWSTMQRELLDRRRWQSRDELASAIFEWIEAFYNPVRRHTSIGDLSPAEFEAQQTAHRSTRHNHIRTCPENRVRLQFCLECEPREFRPSPKPGLLFDPVKVGSNCACADEELFSYRAVREALGHQAEDLFPARRVHRRVRDRWQRSRWRSHRHPKRRSQGAPQFDAVAITERVPLDAAPIGERTVAAAQVKEYPLPVPAPQLRVGARDLRIASKYNVIDRIASKGDVFTDQVVRFCINMSKGRHQCSF